MTSLVTSVRTSVAALRMLLIFTVILGVAYPLAITAAAHVPGLESRADGSLITVDGKVVGSTLIGQSYVDDQGHALAQYFQSRPSAAGDGYDPTATGASNLGPESVVDTLPDPANPEDSGTQSLLTRVCARSLTIGRLDGVDGSRPFCTPDGVGAVLGVLWSGPGYTGRVMRVVSLNQMGPGAPFISTYAGISVALAKYGEDYSHAQVLPIRGDAPASPAVPADAVTASGSGLDPQISPEYATIQEARVARERKITVGQVKTLVARYSNDRGLGFLGEPGVNVLQLNLALDQQYPKPQ